MQRYHKFLGRHWRSFLNLAISIMVFSFLIHKFGNSQLLKNLTHADPVYFILALCIIMLLSGVHLARWRICLAQMGEDIDWRYGLRLLFIGYFFNQSLPSSVGGDFFRIWLTNRSGISMHNSIASVIADRVAAFFGLFVLSIVLSPVVSQILGTQVAFKVVSACFLFFMLPAVFFVYGEKILKLFSRYTLLSKPISLFFSMKLIFGNISSLSRMLWLSALIHLVSGFSFFLIARSIGVNMSILDCICLFPFIIIVSVIPISFGGWGLREGASIFVLGQIGVSPEDALSISVLLGIILAIVGIPGAFLWIFKMHSIAPSQSVQQPKS